MNVLIFQVCEPLILHDKFVFILAYSVDHIQNIEWACVCVCVRERDSGLAVLVLKRKDSTGGSEDWMQPASNQKYLASSTGMICPAVLYM